nr:leader peptide (put.); putative [Plasmid pJS37]AAA25046.1 leader peptide (put.); putative [Plasmid pJS37]
MKKADK